jgi:hypothetical protein
MRMSKAKAMLLVVLCGDVIAAQRQPSGPAPGVLVPVGSHSLHLRRGSGRGTIRPSFWKLAGGILDGLVTSTGSSGYTRANLCL